MRHLYWPLLAAAILFLAWAHTHTDEIPIVLGFVLILSGALGILYPRRFVITLALNGSVVFVVETLVHYRMLTAPYPPAAGIPWPGLMAFIPAAIGAAAGAGLRRVAAGSASV